MKHAQQVPAPAQLTAVVLAGGLGTRLRSVVPSRPKVLAPVRGRPFLTYLLDQLGRSGFRRAVLSTGYLGEQIEAALGAAYGPLTLLYSPETAPLGTGGAIRHAAPLLASDPVLVLNGDSYCGLDFDAFLVRHVVCAAEASLALVHVDDAERYGRVCRDADDMVIRFQEKEPSRTPRGPVLSTPPMDDTGSEKAGWISAGIYLLSHRVVESIPSGRSVSIEREVFPAWVRRGLFGHEAPGPFLDIGTPESYAKATHFFGDWGDPIDALAVTRSRHPRGRDDD